MARVCDITHKRSQVGNHVSHANNKNKRRFYPNLQKKRFWIAAQNRFIRLTVSTQVIRMIDQLGIERVLEKLNKLDLISRSTKGGSTHGK